MKFKTVKLKFWTWTGWIETEICERDHIPAVWYIGEFLCMGNALSQCGRPFIYKSGHGYLTGWWWQIHSTSHYFQLNKCYFTTGVMPYRLATAAGGELLGTFSYTQHPTKDCLISPTYIKVTQSQHQIAAIIHSTSRGKQKIRQLPQYVVVSYITMRWLLFLLQNHSTYTIQIHYNVCIYIFLVCTSWVATGVWPVTKGSEDRTRPFNVTNAIYGSMDHAWGTSALPYLTALRRSP